MEVRLGARKTNIARRYARDEIANGDVQKNCDRRIGRIRVSKRSDSIALVHLGAALSVNDIGSV